MSPRNTKKQADADRYANEQKLETIRNNPDMEIMFIGDEMHARERTPEELARRAALRQANENVRQQNNLENVLEIAATELQSASTVSDDPPDDDWITRLFSIVKDINSEEMQYVWGKILAGEIVAPGSFSLRTLEIVRNMNRVDAETFQKILPYIIKHNATYFLSSNSELNSQYQVYYSDILSLDECGLMNSSGTLSLNLTISGEDSEYCNTDKHLILIKGNDKSVKKVSFQIHVLSNVGIELYNILQHASNANYTMDFAKQIREANKKIPVDISVHEIIADTDDGIKYKLHPTVFFPKGD